jgi:mannose-6-phosphate isomerase
MSHRTTSASTATPPELREKLVLLPQNRVWRTYLGGRVLDELAGKANPADSHFPEDWVGSTTRATNPGREGIQEGVSTVTIAGQSHDFARVLAGDPEYFLGRAHATRFGPRPMLLVKLLDSAIRLHFQVHPTADFARRFLDAASGKTEAYHVLATRPEVREPYIYLGFQRPPTRDALRRMIESQDIAAIEACFDRIPVKPGDTYLVPGGVPHALGEGVFLVEIQEPSDLVVRFEFERGGYVLPESARFMGRGLDFCLDVFDFSRWDAARIARSAACQPHDRRPLAANSWSEQLIGPGQTPCFRVSKTRIADPVALAGDGPCIGIITEGSATIRTGGEQHQLRRHEKFFRPAGLGSILIEPRDTVEILECRPPLA